MDILDLFTSLIETIIARLDFFLAEFAEFLHELGLFL